MWDPKVLSSLFYPITLTNLDCPADTPTRSNNPSNPRSSSSEDSPVRCSSRQCIIKPRQSQEKHNITSHLGRDESGKARLLLRGAADGTAAVLTVDGWTIICRLCRGAGTTCWWSTAANRRPTSWLYVLCLRIKGKSSDGRNAVRGNTLPPSTERAGMKSLRNAIDNRRWATLILSARGIVILSKGILFYKISTH